MKILSILVLTTLMSFNAFSQVTINCVTKQNDDNFVLNLDFLNQYNDKESEIIYRNEFGKPQSLLIFPVITTLDAKNTRSFMTNPLSWDGEEFRYIISLPRNYQRSTSQNFFINMRLIRGLDDTNFLDNMVLVCKKQ